MPKVRAPASKRQSSRQRHKVERKKREHKRDVRKAAKAMRKSGTGGVARRTKKQREMVRLALKVSNANADKEKILSQVLQARETARVMRAGRKHKMVEETQSAATVSEAVAQGGQARKAQNGNASQTSTRQLLYIPAAEANNFAVQFTRSLDELALPVTAKGDDGGAADVQELPCIVYLVTLDARFAVQCIPWVVLDALVEQARNYTGSRPVLLLFVLAKVDLVSAPALVSQLSLVGVTMRMRYAAAGGLPTCNMKVAIAPFSNQFDCTGRHLCRTIAQFERSVARRDKVATSNMEGKACCFIVGYPNTGRRTLCRALACEANQTRVSLVPLRAAQLQLIKRVTKGGNAGQGDGEATVQVRFALPNAKSITLVQFAEDERVRAELQTVTGAEVFFRALPSLERLPEPEAIGCVLFDGIVDKAALAQAFCQPLPVGEGKEAGGMGGATLHMAQNFLRELGKTVRRHKGFYVSPLFVANTGTMGRTTSSSLTAHVDFTSGQQRSQATLLDASYSGATPNKLVRIAITPSGTGRKRQPVVQHGDAHNVLRLGARTFVRELCKGGNVPWAVMRAPHKTAVSLEQVAEASLIFDLALCSGKVGRSDGTGRPEEHYNRLVQALAAVLKPALPLMPNNVLEVDPDLIVAPSHCLDEDIGEASSHGSDTPGTTSDVDEEEGDGDGVEEDDDDDNEEDDDDDNEEDEDSE